MVPLLCYMVLFIVHYTVLNTRAKTLTYTYIYYCNIYCKILLMYRPGTTSTSNTTFYCFVRVGTRLMLVILSESLSFCTMTPVAARLWHGISLTRCRTMTPFEVMARISSSSLTIQKQLTLSRYSSLSLFCFLNLMAMTPMSPRDVTLKSEVDTRFP